MKGLQLVSWKICLHEKIVGLDVSVDETLAVNVFYSGDELIGEKQNCFQAESSGAKVEEVLEAWPKQFHYHHIEVPLRTAPLDLRNPDTALHHPVELRLDVKLGMLCLDAFQFDGNCRKK